MTTTDDAAAPAQQAPEVTEAQRLAALGRVVYLRDGRAAYVRYGMDAIVLLEEAYGGIRGLQEVLASLDREPDGPGAMRTVRDVLLPGLAEWAEDVGEPRERLGRLLDLRNMASYVVAFREAFAEAFPAPSEQPSGAPAPRGGRGKGRSRGASGTTSPPAGTGGQTPSSGG